VKSDAVQKADVIQRAIETAILKDAGFIRKGRTFNRKTQDVLTHVVTFHVYKKYNDDPTLLSIELGIRVPECVNQSFDSTEIPDKFFKDYDCSSALRTDLGRFKGIHEFRGYGEFHYYLEKGDTKYVDETDYIIFDIRDTMTKKVIPFFADFDSRDKILKNLERYNDNDLISLTKRWKLDLIYIYGTKGEIDKAKDVYKGLSEGQLSCEIAKRLGLI
jgi:hypothetical protein